MELTDVFKIGSIYQRKYMGISLSVVTAPLCSRYSCSTVKSGSRMPVIVISDSSTYIGSSSVYPRRQYPRHSGVL